MTMLVNRVLSLLLFMFLSLGVVGIVSVTDVQAQTEDCTIVGDEDGDGDWDCADSDCTIGPNGGTCEPGGETMCGDMEDNDGNLLVDCEDRGACSSSDICSSGVSGVEGADRAFYGDDNIPECGDGVNNDGRIEIEITQEVYDVLIPQAEKAKCPEYSSFPGIDPSNLLRPAISEFPFLPPVPDFIKINFIAAFCLALNDAVPSGINGGFFYNNNQPLSFNEVEGLKLFGPGHGLIPFLGEYLDRETHIIGRADCAQATDDDDIAVSRSCAGKVSVVRGEIDDMTGGTCDNDGNDDGDLDDICCEATEVTCDDKDNEGNEFDNDGDGMANCLDDDCDTVGICEHGTETTCDDSEDNDGDTLIDCDDSDCDEACMKSGSGCSLVGSASTGTVALNVLLPVVLFGLVLGLRRIRRGGSR